MLYIYRASAGSGKTHLLTGFYLRLLFHNELTPSLEGRNMLFGEILAVTFTNKATAEMKERIINELDVLHRTPMKSDFIADLINPPKGGQPLTIEQIQSRALGILTSILNDYTDFHVSTIDSFFQQVLRSFAHELNVQGSYEIELDANSVLDHAVSQFLLNLDEKKDPEAFRWMVEFSKNRLSEGASWNVHEELTNLAKVLTTEAYKKHSSRIADFTRDKDQMRNCIRMLKEVQRDFKHQLAQIGKQGKQLLADHDLLPTDFKGGASSGMKCFDKWIEGKIEQPNKTLIGKSESADNWFAKASPKKNCLSENATQKLLEVLQQGVEMLTGDCYIQYLSAKAIAANFYQLGLLSRLEQEANAYCEQQGIQLLSNTTEMLNLLVKNEGDSPFIYEKTGTRIRSFMIDEFQDTSGMQWANFKPLLTNALGEGNQNLIVGDVKQSIYRWRGSDWELLNSTINRFKPDQQEYDENHNRLADNWRSDEKIITFNNQFFKFAAQQLQQLDPENSEFKKIVQIYDDVEQQIPEGRKHKINQGLLHIETLDIAEEEKAMETAMRRLPEVVIALQEKGFEPKDILILTRKRSECQACAEALLNYQKTHPNCQYPLQVLTNEALRLAGRNSIRTLIAILHHVHDPKSKLKHMTALVCYNNLQLGNMTEAISQYLEGNTLMVDFLQYANKPLYELVESLIALMPVLTGTDESFLQAFRDLTLDYINRNGNDLGGFLKWWDEKSSDFSISTPKDQNAIRIMTIHQSKGLGEKAVVIPYASWNMDIESSHSQIIWCETKENNPFGLNKMVLPINLSSNLKDTIFCNDLANERLRTIIDNLNTAYVAFTRAKNAMVIMMPPAKKNRLEDLLIQYLESEQGKATQWDELEISENTEEAALQPSATNSVEVPNRIANPSDLSLWGNAGNQPNNHPLIKQTERKSKEGALRGITLHAALSAVKDYNHIESPIRHLFGSGLAEIADGSTIDEIIEQVGQMLKKPEVRPWFAPSNHVLCETDIITHTTHTQRPDRIVFTPDNRTIIIDYKTGEMQDESTLAPNQRSYKDQVRYYMKLVGDMGFENIEGYLWYLDQEQIVQV